jgi:capsular polysaccharide biosynthesis protein
MTNTYGTSANHAPPLQGGMMFLRGFAWGEFVLQNHPRLWAIVAMRRNPCEIDQMF